VTLDDPLPITSYTTVDPAGSSTAGCSGVGAGAATAVPGVSAGTAEITCGGVYAAVGAADVEFDVDWFLFPDTPMMMNSRTTAPTIHGHFRFFLGAGGGAAGAAHCVDCWWPYCC
jgi:hypothetical protein